VDAVLAEALDRTEVFRGIWVILRPSGGWTEAA
jgi:hypothetical protein